MLASTGLNFLNEQGNNAFADEEQEIRNIMNDQNYIMNSMKDLFGGPTSTGTARRESATLALPE